MSEHKLGSISIEGITNLLNFSRDVLWIIAPDGNIVHISPSVYILRGIDVEAAKLQHLGQIHPPESAKISSDYFMYMVDEIKEGRNPAPFKGNLDYYHVDGSIVNTEVYAVPMFDDDRTFLGLFGISRDISSRLLKEAEERQAREALHQKFQLMLNGVLEHEVRNALYLIESALNKPGSIERAQVARREIKNLLEILDQIRVFCTEPFTADQHHAKSINVLSMVKEIEVFLSPTLPFELGKQEQIFLHCSETLVHICLLQIFRNAVAYGNPKDAIGVNIFPENRSGALGLMIEITNSYDKRIPLDLSEIFQPFYRGQNSLTRPGTGLGLSILKNIVSYLAGDVTLSQTSVSVTAHLWIPQSK